MDKPKILEGVIKIVRKGGFLSLPDQPKNELYIPTDYTWPAMSGDTVEVEVTNDKTPEGKTIAKVIKVIARGETHLVGTIIKEGDNFLLSPNNERLPQFRLLDSPIKPQVDYRALATFKNWTSKEVLPEATLQAILGPVGEHEAEMQAIIAGHGIVYDFPPAVEAEATEIKKGFLANVAEEAKVRRDFREILTFTIDPADAKDFDDAISFRTLPDGNHEVGVHIADVSHYVRPGMALDTEARRRATSIYLVDRTIPMLPEVLSNDVCSLVPHEERLTFAAVFTLNNEAEIVDEWFGRTIIKSDHRFSYEDAQASLDGKDSTYQTELKTLNKLAYKLRAKKVADGAITFDDTEVKFILDAKGKPIEVVQKVRTDSHLLIEDFMLLANRRVAEFASHYNEGEPNTFIYRVHDWPNMEKLGSLATFLKPLGYDLSLANERLKSTDLNNLLAQAAERAESHIINRAAVRAMAKAVYSTENIGHWGLAFPFYTHFTSPIRRWPDVLVHRLLAIFLAKQKPTQEMLRSISEDVISSSAREVEAAEAERESIKFKQVEYMSAHLGEEYEGIISGAADFGLFIEELSTKSEGLISVRDLDDFYDYDEQTISLVGRKTKKRYRLGDKVRIKVKAADPLRRRLDFSLVE